MLPPFLCLNAANAFLDFGAAQITRGLAVSEADPGQSVTVFKNSLFDPRTGCRFLVEACDYGQLAPLLEPLEEATLAARASSSFPTKLPAAVPFRNQESRGRSVAQAGRADASTLQRF